MKYDDTIGGDIIQTDFFVNEIKPPANYQCFLGAYYRKAVSSKDLWIGIEGSVVLPTLFFDPNRIDLTKPGKYLDNVSVYFGGNSDGQETDIGLLWEIIRYDNGTVSNERLAFRPFMRRTGHSKTGQAAIYQNAPANKSFYWYSNDIVKITLKLVEPGKLKLSVIGSGKSYETIFEANGYQYYNKAEYKRVNAIDQVANEGKPVQPTKTKVFGAKWLEVYLLRMVNSNLVKAVMHPKRFTSMKCPSSNFINVFSYDENSSIENINLSGDCLV
ncbi:unnamed protein product [Brachionus calyciflorus]|uniref:Uncharacterized protein n=1 Tax=Brachionus calyciflorus TaxID=104777 RepID=A0A814S2R0_9BILA|nr:unnamed protein product [Brachionus calyciflorus]